ncbi:MAG: glutathione synthase [Deltaproteobacteria bacterium]|nr:glutathione synthase [Deltaproteobacteria bacterium]
MKICFVVRSVYSQQLNYTTTHLAYEAHQRGHEVVYTTVNSFSATHDLTVRATVVSPGEKPFESRLEFLRSLQSGFAERQEVTLSDFDVVFLRYNPNELDGEKDKSKNPAIEFGRLLKLHGVLVLNDPTGLSKAASKMYLSSFPTEIRAKTLITRSAYKIKEFVREIKKPTILKPLSGFGGQDVFFIKNAKEININQIISTVAKSGYVMAQEYIPEVKNGDKRLLLLNGSPIFIGSRAAMYRRMSPKGDIRSNMHVGGKRKKVAFTKIEAQIADLIRPKLIADGLYFVGADIVGNKLLEINVFCPGGINNINELYDINVGSAVIDDLEKKVRLISSRPQGRTSLSLIKNG